MNQTVKRLSDYQSSAYVIENVELDFQLHPTATVVTTTQKLRRERTGEPLVLNGDELSLDEVRIDGRVLEPREFEATSTSLTIYAPPAAFVLLTKVTINPTANTALMGLYVSGGRFCTQCESEGFRRITYFMDRPDVLTVYTVRMEAEKAANPTLLSNGDCIDSGDLPDGRHYAVWKDPYPKPAYLFALVAGKFESIRDSFRTMSGKHVDLAIHVDEGNGPRAKWAMDSLKRSMAWDERTFRREYDLSQFHIVAVRDFNYGAMENKSLNVFNASVLLADDATETDADFGNVERVVAHEYFHNWTGNRITLRDWFQLCLKEGLTVYRDQEFTADENSRPVQRIKDVEHLRDVQFPEDAGPLAHPPRPDQFVKIENFYTPTVYRKGAEVVRVLSALLGADAFQKGMQLYFDTHDGQAVTVEDFVECFAKSSGRNLDDFFRWYTQAGTPAVKVRFKHDASKSTLSLSVSQSTAPTPGQPDKLPLPIPLRIGFIGHDGKAMPVRLSGDNAAGTEHNLVLEGSKQEWLFEDVPAKAIPAVMRGFMAPVTLDDGLTHEERLIQMAHEPDSFTRWDAGQSLLASAIVAASGKQVEGPALPGLIAALDAEMRRSDDDPSFAALALDIPSVHRLVQTIESPDPTALHTAREQIRRAVASELEAKLVAAVKDKRANSSDRSGKARGFRMLKSSALRLLASLGTKHEALLFAAYQEAVNMTGQMSALRALSDIGGAMFDRALADFEMRWRDQPLVMDKWFSLQASAPRTDAAKLRELVKHPMFTVRNPNRARAVYGVFGGSNLLGFNAADGSGYEIIGQAIEEIDAINPMVAGRLVRSFETWRKFDQGRQAKAKAVLTRLASLPKLSSMQRELIEKMIG